MDKDEQAPTTSPETPEVEKPAEPAEAPKVEETSKAEEASETEAPVTETTTAEATPTETESTTAETALVETEPAKSDVAAEMDRLLNEEAASSKPEQEVKPMVGKSHNHVGIIIVLSFLVLISVGFAIYMYLTSNKKVPCDCPKCEQTECNCDKDDDDETSSADYIYVGEWGVKFKKPEISNVNYAYMNGSYMQEMGDMLGVGTDLDFAIYVVRDSTMNGQAMMLKTTCATLNSEALADLNGSGCNDVKVKDDLDLAIVYNGSFASESADLLEHLSNSENYSEF